ncbi:shikimate kinase [Caldifermentibacillus hisashii]|uniref:shikimate kinase n=1 Tax=Caldifermentibacillus hisashii TaxID=996558 RepID=UPI003101104D
MKNKLVIIGMPGSGKTTIGKLVAEKTGKSFIDLDEFIVEWTKKTIPQLFERGEDHFREIETRACMEIAKRKDLIVSTGGGVIKKPINIELLGDNGVIVFLDRPVDLIMADIIVQSRPLLKEGKEKLLALYEERYELYKKYADEIIANDRIIEEVCTDIIGIMNKYEMI